MPFAHVSTVLGAADPLLKHMAPLTSPSATRTNAGVWGGWTLSVAALRPLPTGQDPSTTVEPQWQPN